MADVLGLRKFADAITKRNISGYATAVENFLEQFKSDKTKAQAVALLDSYTGVSSGQRIAYLGSEAPDGWLICDGREISRTTYANLFTAIGTTHGVGDGSSSFNLPDLRNKHSIGSGGTRINGPNTAVGSTNDNDGVVLAIGNLPEHDHDSGTYRTDKEDPHTHIYPAGSGGSGYIAGGSRNNQTGRAGSHDHPITGQSKSSGGTEALDVKQKHVYVNWIIKI